MSILQEITNKNLKIDIYIKELKELLNNYNQDHLLMYYDSLSNENQEILFGRLNEVLEPFTFSSFTIDNLLPEYSLYLDKGNFIDNNGKIINGIDMDFIVRIFIGEKIPNIINDINFNSSETLFSCNSKNRDIIFQLAVGLLGIIKDKYKLSNLVERANNYNEIIKEERNFETKKGYYLHIHPNDDGYAFSYYNKKQTLIWDGTVFSNDFMHLNNILMDIICFSDNHTWRKSTKDLYNIKGLKEVDKIVENLNI